jgi:hypothetical protein
MLASLPARPRSLMHADQGHAHTDEEIDPARVWNSIVDAANSIGTEGTSEEEEEGSPKVFVKQEENTEDIFYVSPNH